MRAKGHKENLQRGKVSGCCGWASLQGKDSSFHAHPPGQLNSLPFRWGVAGAPALWGLGKGVLQGLILFLFLHVILGHLFHNNHQDTAGGFFLCQALV